MRTPGFREIILVFLIIGSAYGYFFSQQDSNTNSRLALVKAVVEEKRLEIDSYHDNVLDTIDKSYYNGHYYSDKAIGTSLIGIPIYYIILKISILLGYAIKIKVFKQLLTLFAISLFNALLATSLYKYTRELSNSTWFSLLVTLAICLGTPLFLYSTTYYAHALAGFLLFAAFYIWFRMRQSEKINFKAVALSGFLAGLSIITEYTAGIIALLLGFYILWVVWEKKQLQDKNIYLALIGGALPPLLAMAFYNYAIFKTPLAIGYMHEATAQFSTEMQKNIMGIGLPDLRALFYMTFHTTMGIFWQSPVLLMAFPGWIVMWQTKKYRPEAIFSLAVILAYFLILSGYYLWWGGLAFTPRHIIPALPFFGIPLIFLSSKYSKILILVLALISIAQMFIVTSTTYFGLYDMLVNVSTDHFYRMFENSTIYSIYWPNFLAQQLTNNQGMSLFHLTGYASLVPLLIIEFILLGAFVYVIYPSIGDLMTKRGLKDILLVFLIIVSAYGYFYSQQDSNTNSRLALSKAIVEENRFEIDSYHESDNLKTIDVAYYNGHYYSDKAIGTSLIGVPVYYVIIGISNLLGYTIKTEVFKVLLTLLGISVLNALLATSLYQFTKDTSHSARFSLLVTLAICLGTPLYLYSTTFYSHALVGYLLFVAFYTWFKMRQNEKIGLGKVVLSGFILGYSIITEYPTALIAIILFLYILWVLWERKQLRDIKIYLALLGGALPALAILAFYNYSIFKTPFATGYMHESAEQFSSVMQTKFLGFDLPDLRALFYMTFHTTMGIYWQSPVLLLAFPGWIMMWQTGKYRPEAIFSFGAILLYFLILSGYYWWWGGLAFTPRYNIVVYPFFAIPMTFLSQKYYKALGGLTFLSIGQMFIVTSTRYDGLRQMLANISTDHFYRMFENSTIYTIYWPNFLSQQLSDNQGMFLFHLDGFASLIPLLVVEIILLYSFISLTRNLQREENLMDTVQQ